MKAASLHRWSVAHTWSSLVCTLFLIAICLTGLPLIFSDEIDRLSDDGPPYATEAAVSERISVDSVLEKSREAFPTEIIRSIYWPDDQPAAIVRLAPDDDADDALDHNIEFDAITGVERRRDPVKHHLKFMEVMRHVHEDLFVDLPGELFLGFMAALFVVAIVSGTVLYAPFMRHVEFGKRRAARGSRVAWLDTHNVLSAVALVWMGVLGVTGIINELATPLFVHWLTTDVATDFPQNDPQALPAHLASVDTAIHNVEIAMPHRKVESVDFPTHHFGSPAHYIVWTKGDTPLTSRIDVPAFVDARTGRFVKTEVLPWYLLALELSRPLHFGDYGGLPLKVLWALFDILTLIVLVSGLKLWFNRRRNVRRRKGRLALHAAESG
jgi:uncharacterized iron-regulated membrane protein